MYTSQISMSAVNRLITVNRTVTIPSDHTPVAAIVVFRFLMQMGELVMVCARMADRT